MTVNILNTARALLIGVIALMILSACGLEENQKWERVEYDGDAYSEERTAGSHYKYVLVDMADEKGPVLEPILDETKDFASDMSFNMEEENLDIVPTIKISTEENSAWKSPLVPRETTMLPRISKRILLEPMMPPFIRERAMPVVNNQDDMVIQKATPIFNADQKTEYVSKRPEEDLVKEDPVPKVIKTSIYEDAEFLFEKRMVK